VLSKISLYNGAMKKLLVIGYVWPEPNSSAAGARMLQLLSCFQNDGYEITYASPAQNSDHAVNLPDLNIKPVNIEINSTSFDDFVKELQPSAVLFDRFMMEEQFAWRIEKYCPNALRVLDTEDLHCLRLARQKMAKANIDAIISEVDNQHLYSDQAKREIAAILRCDLTVMISEYEMTFLQERFAVPKNILAYIPFMLDAPKQADFKAFEERQHFVSIGNFRHEPNWDAVLCLKKHIWPLIRKKLPKAELHVYGAYPPKKASQLHNEKQGFLVKGWVEDAQKMLNEARVLLAPLRFGAGLKGKFLDAAQCGLPSVTTSIGSEGLFGEDKNQQLNTLLSHDDFIDFSEAAAKLYENEPLWGSLQNNCQGFIEQRFDRKKYVRQLLGQISDIEANLSEHRLNNFMGSMLRHHSLKSTQYMAQWIEAKNKLPENH
jgi:glycosyltransferase involved in cell wall biosynthesis